MESGLREDKRRCANGTSAAPARLLDFPRSRHSLACCPRVRFPDGSIEAPTTSTSPFPPCVSLCVYPATACFCDRAPLAHSPARRLRASRVTPTSASFSDARRAATDAVPPTTTHLCSRLLICSDVASVPTRNAPVRPDRDSARAARL